jgi:hypothetical protein
MAHEASCNRQNKASLIVSGSGTADTDMIAVLIRVSTRQMLRKHRSLEGLLYNPMMKMMRVFLLFHFYGTPVE